MTTRSGAWFLMRVMTDWGSISGVQADIKINDMTELLEIFAIFNLFIFKSWALLGLGNG